jgi:predicted flap endonuclease-1-like 5' DNA nuclease
MGANYIQLMAILQKLKSLLGFDDAGSERGSSQEVGVTVEREREGEHDREQSAASDAEPSGTDDQPVVAETDAAASTDSMTDPSDVPHKPAEPAEATGPSQADAAPTEDPADAGNGEPSPPGAAVEPQEDAEEAEPAEDAEEAEPAPQSTSSPDDQAESADADDPADESVEDVPSEPVDVIKGIGPAYADRMADAGVETVADLAAADADDLESQTEISAKRIQGWIDRAKVR